MTGKGNTVFIRGRPISVDGIKRERLKGKPYAEIAKKYRISITTAWKIGEDLYRERPVYD